MSLLLMVSVPERSVREDGEVVMEKLALAPGVMVKGVVTPARAKEDPDIVTELIVRS